VRHKPRWTHVVLAVVVLLMAWSVFEYYALGKRCVREELRPMPMSGRFTGGGVKQVTVCAEYRKP
jgi:hypothetical protein